MFNCIILFQNRKSINRNKEHRAENQSPTDKNYQQTDDYYSIPNTTTVSPVSIPIQIPRMSYDVPYHPNPSYPPSQPFSQAIYPPQAGTFPIHEMYSSNPSNVVLANGGQYYPTQQTEYANINHHSTQNVDIVKRPNWDIMVSRVHYASFVYI